MYNIDFFPFEPKENMPVSRIRRIKMMAFVVLWKVYDAMDSIDKAKFCRLVVDLDDVCDDEHLDKLITLFGLDS